MRIPIADQNVVALDSARDVIAGSVDNTSTTRHTSTNKKRPGKQRSTEILRYDTNASTFASHSSKAFAFEAGLAAITLAGVQRVEHPSE